jgi:hypothetical protein
MANVDQPVHGTNAKGEPICNSPKRGGGFCQSTKLVRAGRCRIHGGKSRFGLSHPGLKHGKYSKDLRKGSLFLKRFEDAMAHPDAINLRAENALMDARIGELLKALHGGAGPDAWKKAHRLFMEMKASINSQDKETLKTSMLGLEATLKGGLDESSVWKAINTQVQIKRKLVDTEDRRQRDLNQRLTLGEVMNLVGILAASIHSHVGDRRVLALIQADFDRGMKLVGASAA